jgi:catechol 2,3-dioxygenase-like lactoylglutathione lyase family enzyme
VKGPDVDCEQCHPILLVSDVGEAVEFYTRKLGFWLAFAEGDPPTFAGLNLGHVQVFLEHGTPAPQGCSVYFVVSDADKLHRFHQSSGVAVLEPLNDRAYRLRDYTVQDLYGYRLTFGHRLPNRVTTDEEPRDSERRPTTR